MKAENRGQLVRGGVAIGDRYSGCVSSDPKQAEQFGTLLAYTHWYRHDDDLTELDRDLQKLVNVYRDMNKTGSMMYYYEYKDYKK